MATWEEPVPTWCWLFYDLMWFQRQSVMLALEMPLIECLNRQGHAGKAIGYVVLALATLHDVLMIRRATCLILLPSLSQA
eukprot:scaffold57475_cov18-Tisochrysis_lutea.AAC.2